MKRYFSYLILSLGSILSLYSQNIENDMAIFKNIDGSYENESQYLPQGLKSTAMIISRKTDPFPFASKKNRSGLDRFLTDKKSRVAIYVCNGDNPKFTQYVQINFMEKILKEMGKEWDMSSESTEKNFSKSAKMLYGNLGSFSNILEEKPAAISPFMGDKRAVHTQYYVGAGKSQLMKVLKIPLEFFFDVYTYYDKAADKSVVAIFYKIGLNPNIDTKMDLGDSFKSLLVSLMMNSSGGSQYKDIQTMIANYKWSEMLTSFKQYFSLKPGKPKTPQPSDSTVNNTTILQSINSNTNVFIEVLVFLNQDPGDTIIITKNPIKDGKPRRVQIKGFYGNEFAENDRSIYIIDKNSRILEINKTDGTVKINPNKFDTPISDIVCAQNGDLLAYVREKGLLNYYSGENMWKPEDAQASFELCIDSKNGNIILSNKEWIVVLNSSYQELYSYETLSKVKLSPDNFGNIWYGSTDGSMVRFAKGETISDYISLEGNKITSIAGYHDGGVLVAIKGSISPGGIYSINQNDLSPKKLYSFQYSTGNDISCIQHNSKNEYFACNENKGIMCFNGIPNNDFSYLKVPLAFNPVNATDNSPEGVSNLYIDRYDNLWIIHNNAGIILYNPLGVKGYGELQGIIEINY